MENGLILNRKSVMRVMKYSKYKNLSLISLIKPLKESEKLPKPPDDFEKLVMSRIYEVKNIKFPLEKLIYGIAGVLFLIMIGFMIFRYFQPVENSFMIPLDDVKIILETKNNNSISVKEPVITHKPQVSLTQNKIRKIPQQESAQLDVNIGVSYDLKAHIGMELVEMLDKTIKAIERGDQEWEIEI